MSAYFRYVFFLQADGFVSNGSLIAAIWKSCDGHRWAIDGPSMGLNGVSVREWLVQIGNNNNKYSSNCIYYQEATSLHFTFMTSGPIRIISSLSILVIMTFWPILWVSLSCLQICGSGSDLFLSTIPLLPLLRLYDFLWPSFFSCADLEWVVFFFTIRFAALFSFTALFSFFVSRILVSVCRDNFLRVYFWGHDFGLLRIPSFAFVNPSVASRWKKILDSPDLS